MNIEAQGISVRIDGSTLLDDVSMTVASGEIVAVAGPNGAGKSTLLGVLAGDRRPDAGKVTLDGRPLTDWSRGELALRRAVMSADSGVAFSFSVAEVVQLGRTPLHQGAPREADRRAVDELLAAVDCERLARRTFSTLSTGERQRVQLARAVAQVTTRHRAESGTRYLLLDEPTSSLDPAHQLRAMQLLRQEAEAGSGIAVVLHDLNLAAAYADRIALMRDATVVAAGPPSEVLRADMLESVFDVPMLVVPHPHQARVLVVADAG